MTTFGSWRRMCRSPVAKVRPISGLTSIWDTPASLTPEEVSGVAASPATNMIYLSTRGRLAAFDLGTEATVGRAAGCQIALPDDTYVSTLHARVFQRDGQAFVEDLGSTNGTYVNGDRVTSAVPLRRGDRLQVGSTVMEVG